MTIYVDIAEADARAEELVDRVLAGERVMFTQDGRQYAIMCRS